ncbi:MAG: hypothetical protein ACUVUR_05085 [bacterium]
MSRAVSQVIERTLYLPDSIGSPEAPDRIFYNPGTNTVFILGDEPVICVLDM